MNRKCQAWTSRGFRCPKLSQHEVEGVGLCNVHRDVLGRKGGVRIRREPQGPIEAIVDMPDGYRIYPVEQLGAAETGRACRVCGCTDLDCRGCVERTGAPCYWIEADLCSACRDVA